MAASFEQLLDDNLSTVIMKQGSLVTGIVIDILDNHIVVHVGLKSEAAVAISEFYNESGELELEFNPQGTLAERMRAAGCGIPGFYTKTGVGTVIAEGKEHKDFNGETYILETGLFADISIVKAWKADETGNLVFRKTARNFNPPAAMCGKICVAEVEEIVPTGSLDPDLIHLPGIYVHRLIQGDHEKRIEQRTLRT